MVDYNLANAHGGNYVLEDFKTYQDVIAETGFDAETGFIYHGIANVYGNLMGYNGYLQTIQAYSAIWKGFIDGAKKYPNFKYFPLVSPGWDSRAIGEFYQPNSHDQSRSCDGAFDDHNDDKLAWGCSPDGGLFKTMLENAKKTIDANPEVTGQVLVIGTWNDLLEGHYLIPTAGDHGAHAAAVKAVFKPNDFDLSSEELADAFRRILGEDSADKLVAKNAALKAATDLTAAKVAADKAAASKAAAVKAAAKVVTDLAAAKTATAKAAASQLASTKAAAKALADKTAAKTAATKASSTKTAAAIAASKAAATKAAASQAAAVKAAALALADKNAAKSAADRAAASKLASTKAAAKTVTDSTAAKTAATRALASKTASDKAAAEFASDQAASALAANTVFAVRFGSSTQYVTKLVHTGTAISCSYTVFGDPLPGRVKNCYDAKGTPIVSEGGSFMFSTSGYYSILSGTGPAPASVNSVTIQFGTGNQLFNRSFRPGTLVHCATDVFGDPAPGVGKSCYTANGDWAGNENSSFTAMLR